MLPDRFYNRECDSIAAIAAIASIAARATDRRPFVKLGMAVRTMGPESEPSTLVACVRAAEATAVDEIWIQDHLAIPPDDAEGSDGRYLDPLTTLAYLAALTERIGLGTGVLNLPYRPPLPTAKAIATVQELSGGRLLLGVGIGWMAAEFRALGVPRPERARRSDETLVLWHQWFGADEAEANGQPFLFRPRPARPLILVGGNGHAARRRAVHFGDAWLPMVGDPKKLAHGIEDLEALATAAGRPTPEVAVMTRLPLADSAAATERLAALHELGVRRVVHAERYVGVRDFTAAAEALRRAGGSLRDAR